MTFEANLLSEIEQVLSRLVRPVVKIISTEPFTGKVTFEITFPQLFSGSSESNDFLFWEYLHASNYWAIRNKDGRFITLVEPKTRWVILGDKESAFMDLETAKERAIQQLTTKNPNWRATAVPAGTFK